MPSENPILGKPSPLLLIVISLLSLDYDLLSPKHICGPRYKKNKFSRINFRLEWLRHILEIKDLDSVEIEFWKY